MKSKKRKIIITFLLCLTGVTFAQEQNPTIWPYGGLEDSKRRQYMKKNPLTFNQANFNKAQFHNRVDFREAKFEGRADFWRAQFDSLADFREAQFDSYANFWLAEFHSLAVFEAVKFDSLADFWLAHFNSRSDFRRAKFRGFANFRESIFGGQANFFKVQFDNYADFWKAKFDSLGDFKGAIFKNKVNFNSTKFNKTVDFRYAQIDSIADFSLTEIRDTIFVGIPRSSILQKYDFTRAKLLKANEQIIQTDKIKKTLKRTIKYPGAKILIYGSVDLRIQLEKFKFITLCDTLDYYVKKDIISTLKEVSFKGDKYSKERFELDYIFDRSTMYQKESPDYEKYSAFNPISWGHFLYNLTMGLG